MGEIYLTAGARIFRPWVSQIHPSPKLDNLLLDSLENDDTILSHGVTIEDVELALKMGKVVGQMTYLLNTSCKYSGYSLTQTPV